VAILRGEADYATVSSLIEIVSTDINGPVGAVEFLAEMETNPPYDVLLLVVPLRLLAHERARLVGQILRTLAVYDYWRKSDGIVDPSSPKIQFAPPTTNRGVQSS